MTRRKLRILVVDDEAAMREVLEMRLNEWGFTVRLADSGAAARKTLRKFEPDAIISDVVLPDLTGLELLDTLQAGEAARPVVLITAYGAIDTAVEAMKKGAFDFLTKPLDYDKLRATLEAARAEIERRSSVATIQRKLEADAGLGELVGVAEPMQQLYDTLRVLAESDASAILTGESGTGKELAARTIHQLSERRGGPFVALNTSAIPEGIIESELFGHEKGAFTGASGSRAGYFELAHGGTLFLDEIGEMPAALQPKILRALEDGRIRRLGGRRETQVDVRVLAATNREIEKAREDGTLREDLYYRLSVFTVPLPPLRDRLDDVPLLAQHFVQQFNDKHGAAVHGVADDALTRLAGYEWPGNVRELRNVLERAVILARQGWVETVHLPPFIRDPADGRATAIVLPAGVTAAEAEKRLILETLKRFGNNKTHAARALDLDVKTIRNKLRAYEATEGA